MPATVPDIHAHRILILDFGAQYSQLIARRVRKCRVYSELVAHTISPEAVRARNPYALILSGGPASVYGEDVPTADRALLDIAPVLGICYGMMLIAQLEGGAVSRAGGAASGACHRAGGRRAVASAR